MYHIRILEAATDQLGRLDRSVGARITKRIRWLAANLGIVQPEALTADLAGLYKLRVGDYRVLYEILHDEQTIVIHFIGNRREVYRRRS